MIKKTIKELTLFICIEFITMFIVLKTIGLNISWQVYLIFMLVNIIYLVVFYTYQSYKLSKEINMFKERSNKSIENPYSASSILLNQDSKFYELANQFNRLQFSMKKLYKKKESALRRYETLINDLSIGVISLDYRHNIRSLNAEARKILAIDKSITLPAPDYIVNNIQILNLIRSSFANKENQHALIKVKINDLEKTIEIKTNIQKESNKKDSLLILLSDVTDIISFEQMQSDFLVNVSHEFKTPLSSIKGFAETLLTEAGDDKKIRNEFLQIINQQADRLNEIVDDVISISSIENTNVIYKKETIALKEYVADNFSKYNKYWPEKNISLENNVASDEQINVEKRLFDDVVLNILKNAIKYNVDNGKIIVSCLEDETSYQIKIQDTGFGISSEQQERVFERFYRGDLSHQHTDINGSGLGLSIASEAIKRLNGSIKLNSKIGVGSEFIITIPKQ